MAFLDIQFPQDIAGGARSAIAWQTQVVILDSGIDHRNILWSADQASWRVGYGIRDWDDLHVLYAFFHVVRGQAHSFRFKDWIDFEVPTLMPFAIGDGSTTVFPVTKTYDAFSSGNAYVKPISKLVVGTVRIFVNATEIFSGFTIDYTAASVVFTAPPTAGVVLAWTGDHDKHARFASDDFHIALETFAAGMVPDITVIEIKES